MSGRSSYPHHYPPTAGAYDSVPPSDYYKPPVYSTTPAYPATPGYAHHEHAHYAPRPPSPTSSFSSSSYAGSAGSDSRERSPDLIGHIQEKLEGALDHMELDRCIAIQAQTSGHLNGATSELIAMRIETSRKLYETKQLLQQGMKDARRVKEDLEWSEKKVQELSRKTKEIYPREYEGEAPSLLHPEGKSCAVEAGASHGGARWSY
ncbi:hypothetical protein BJ508DRAFT_145614 [Ascobolus immersus RN42]|uniref:Biogenesis of lysosome-related organelles complex 1 subunit KXD1 n=1 Tax=Ascobolus immersus RN42 TaxID=1160509 RepID=A0A3N4I131_ASCIM|nr:hypothetical protein BJ508DRAFT_145614 [Ascobolus immersus RN42]